MLFSASFVKVGAEKAVFFLWELIKLHFHVYLKHVQFLSKERLYKFCVLRHGLHQNAIYPAWASPCVKNEDSDFKTYSKKSKYDKV